MRRLELLLQGTVIRGFESYLSDSSGSSRVVQATVIKAFSQFFLVPYYAVVAKPG